MFTQSLLSVTQSIQIHIALVTDVSEYIKQKKNSVSHQRTIGRRTYRSFNGDPCAFSVVDLLNTFACIYLNINNEQKYMESSIQFECNTSIL